jgi:hypothetical protein
LTSVARFKRCAPFNVQAHSPFFIFPRNAGEERDRGFDCFERLFLFFDPVRAQSRPIFFARELLQSGPAADRLLGFV